MQGVKATGMIIDDDVSARSRALEVLLASFGRTVASEAVGMVEERFADTAAGARVTLGGHALSLDPATASGTGDGDGGRRRPGGSVRGYPSQEGRPFGAGGRAQSVDCASC